MLKFRHASRASQGGRNYQEDASATWPGTSALSPRTEPAEAGTLVAVLADGMGGHAAGDVASRIVCTQFLAAVAASTGTVQFRLARGLVEANEAIFRKVEAEPGIAGMGATLVGLHFGPAGAQWISVGDSPLWLWRRGDLVRLNEDHSLAPLIDQLVADGKMSAEDAQNDPRRHYLRAAVTGEELELIDKPDAPLVLEAGDIVLVASDGLHTLEEEEIRRLISAWYRDGVEAIAEALLRAVGNVGDPHQDNTTVIVIAAETV